MISAQEESMIRDLASQEDFEDAVYESVGYIFHGIEIKGRKVPGKNSNLLHFAHCNKLEKLSSEQPIKFWFSRIRTAREHLDEAMGSKNWKWCKQCESEITQRLLEQEGF
ncbi:MAG: hypothetical protein RJA81_1777 [Planctomycetota bacterium]|jgi:hypothetical protein